MLSGKRFQNSAGPGVEAGRTVGELLLYNETHLSRKIGFTLHNARKDRHRRCFHGHRTCTGRKFVEADRRHVPEEPSRDLHKLKGPDDIPSHRIMNPRLPGFPEHLRNPWFQKHRMYISQDTDNPRGSLGQQRVIPEKHIHEPRETGCIGTYPPDNPVGVGPAVLGKELFLQIHPLMLPRIYRFPARVFPPLRHILKYKKNGRKRTISCEGRVQRLTFFI